MLGAMPGSSKEQVLQAASRLLQDGLSVSLDTVARAVELTKAGVMHYFPTKAALMLALVDEQVEQWIDGMTAALLRPLEHATAEERVLVYLDWCLNTGAGAGDLAMLSDPRLRDQLTSRWTQRMAPWFQLPADLPLERSARIAAVRLLADGAWFAHAIDFLPPTSDQHDVLRRAARTLLEQ